MPFLRILRLDSPRNIPRNQLRETHSSPSGFFFHPRTQGFWKIELGLDGSICGQLRQEIGVWHDY
jgi:hypothetical protein